VLLTGSAESLKVSITSVHLKIGGHYDYELAIGFEDGFTGRLPLFSPSFDEQE
jgi:hypothetical protein